MNEANHDKTLKKRLLSLLLFIVPLSQISIDLYSPSLPSIAKYFSTTESYVQNTITVYFLGFGIGQLIFGPLSDVFGRKKVILWGLSLFFLFSFACPFSLNISVFLFFRFFSTQKTPPLQRKSTFFPAVLDLI